MEKIPFTIIGGGIVGVMVARKIRARFPDLDIALLDREPFAGHHNTTRNSGVLHAGIYYETGSLKHRLCIEGHRQWQRLAQELDIPILLCGKYVIATNEEEKITLKKYFETAQRNGVVGLRKMAQSDFAEIEDYTHALDGFYSPQTGILDISAGINRLFSDLGSRGVITLLNTPVSGLKMSSHGWSVRAGTDEFETKILINCAGAGAVEIRNQLGLTDIQNKFVKGNYLKLTKPYYNRRLIYPAPLPNLKGLGVHTSFHLDKIIRFGPNTEDVDSIDYKNSEKNIEEMYPAIAEKFKGIRKEDLVIDYTGVRTKILKNGKLFTDFLIQGPREHGRPGYFETLGIESPGMTAAPAIADELVEKIEI